MAKIYAPNEEYDGRVADVRFDKGVAETDDPAVIGYCRGAGYRIDDQEPATPEAEQDIDPRDVVPAQVGTPLRDAAVDPAPEDFLPPTNAGEANPHGPEVVAPGVHAAPPAPIVPGPVPHDPDEQAEKETDAARRVLVEGEPATAATDVARPAQSAPKAAWVDYAVARGEDRATAEEANKADLIDKYGRVAPGEES